MDKIYISSDHGGFELKKEIVDYLSDKGKSEIVDLGPDALDPNDDYTVFAENLSKKVQNDSNSIGILICRSGIGVSIVANKFKGIYAALCFSEKHAEMSRKHNNANVLCLDADYSKDEVHFKIIHSFIINKFEGMETRHGRRVREIGRIEENNFRK